MAEFALRMVVAPAAVFVALSAAQTLAGIRAYRPGGIFDARLTPVSKRLAEWVLGAGLRWPVFTARWVAVISALRIAGAIVLVLPKLPSEVLALAAVATAGLGVIHSRFTLGRSDWGEQAVKVVLLATALGWFGGTERTVTWALWFIAAHACLAYCAAGVFKITSRAWRDGTALWTLMSLPYCGHPPLGDWLRRHPRWSAAISWSSIGWEIAFPLALVLPPWGLVAVLAAGAVFHLACAYAMGLNTFLWAFVAAYPAIVFVNYSLRAWVF